MNKLILILFSILPLGLPDAFGQYTEAKEYGIKGKIKCVVTHRYELISQKGGNWVPTDTMTYYMRSVLNFHPNGRIDSHNTSFNGENRVKRSYSYSTQNKYLYNSNGEKLKGEYTYKPDQMDEIRLTYLYEWLSPHCYTETTMKDSAIFSQTFYYLNKEFHDSAYIFQQFERNDTTVNYQIVNEFNDSGNITKTTDVNKMNNTIEVDRFEYFKFDKFSNPTISYQYENNNSSPRYVIIKKYEYYE